MNIFYVMSAIAAIFGLCLSAYIARTKHTAQPLVCPLNGHCDAVVQSRYSKFLGIPLEYVGITYYGLATFGYTLLAIVPLSPASEFVFAMYAMTAIAFFFSLYLTFIQAFALRQWCTWCLVSAAVSTLLFFLVVYATPLNWTAFIDSHMVLITFVGTLGVIFGVGGTTIGDILFFSFLKDLKISKDEAAILKTVGQVTWVGLACLLFTSTVLYSTHPSLLLTSPGHGANVLLLLIILANALFLHLLVEPEMVHISFGGEHDHTTGELRFLRQFSFALLAVSLVSWYTLFILYFLGTQLTSMSVLLGGYALAVVLMLGTSQVVERRLALGKLLAAL